MKDHAHALLYGFAGLLLTALLAGCDEGTLTVELTDAPADDLSALVITIQGVDVESADGSRERFDFEPVIQVDLRQLVDGNRLTLLDEVSIAADDYRAVILRLDDRLRTDASDAPISPIATRRDGRTQRLRGIPEETRAERSFTIDELDSERILLDIDLRRSVRENDDDRADDRLRFVPELRAVRADRAGSVSGLIGPEITGRAGCLAAVYVFEGADAELTTLSDPNPPLATVLGRIDLDGLTRYRVDALEEGDYRLAVTCDAANDDPEDPDGDVTFIDDVTLRLNQQQTQVVNIPN